jgi:hypothetical protein
MKIEAIEQQWDAALLVWRNRWGARNDIDKAGG